MTARAFQAAFSSAAPWCLAAALWLPPAADAEPTFFLGGPDPCPSCTTLSFDDTGLAPGTPVTTQFAAAGVTFRNVKFDDGTIGQDSAPGFAGGSLVNSGAESIVIQFSGPQQFAAFAYANCCGGQTLAAYLDGQLIAMTQLTLGPSRFLSTRYTQARAEAADKAYDQAAAAFAADVDAVAAQTALIDRDQQSLDAAIEAVAEAQAAFALDYVQLVTCNNPVCEAYYLVLLAADAAALDKAEGHAGAANAQLQADLAQLTVLQYQYNLDRSARDAAHDQKIFYDRVYQDSLLDPPGPGFIGFGGTPFDALVITLMQDVTDFPITTLIDTLEMAAPEPPTAALAFAALVLAAGLRRFRVRAHESPARGAVG